VADPAGGPAGRDRRRSALVLVAGTALVLAGLGASPVPLAVALVVAGVGPAVWAFLRLVPAGTARLAPGMPAAVAVRGILTFAFFGADLYVSLAITDGRGRSTWLAGAGLTAATLLWTTGSWIQQRIVHRLGPRRLVQRGFLLVAIGIVGMLVVVQPVPPELVVPVWGLAGLGMGLAYAPLSVTVLSLAEPGHEGAASSSLQLCDVLGVSLGTGLSGVFVALGDGRGWATTSSLTFAFAMTALVAMAGVAAAGRLPRTFDG
jgi:MFS family permease